jgi:hypothetical protein
MVVGALWVLEEKAWVVVVAAEREEGAVAVEITMIGGNILSILQR